MTSRYDFTPEFQDNILRLMACDPGFLFGYRKAVEADYFTTPEDVAAAKALLDVFDAAGASPTLGSALEACEASAGPDVDVEEVRDRLRFVFRDGQPRDAAFIKERVLDFGQRQRLQAVLLQGPEFLEQGDFGGYESAVREALTLGAENVAAVYDYYQQLEDRLTASRGAVASVVPCNVPVLSDRIPEGGLGRGEMGILIGLPQRGKTELMVNLGIGALKGGRRVFHASVGDMTERKVGARYDAAITGRDKATCRLNPDDTKRLVGEFLDQHGVRDGLRIKFWPAKRVTVAEIERYIRWMEARTGWLPDLIIVDYGQKIAPRRKHGEGMIRMEHEEVYEDLRAMAGVLNAALWTAQQANRGQFSNERPPGMAEAAEAFGPMRDADIVIGVAGTKIDDDTVKMALRGAKVRDSDTATDWIGYATVKIATHRVVESENPYPQDEDTDHDDDSD